MEDWEAPGGFLGGSERHWKALAGSGSLRERRLQPGKLKVLRGSLGRSSWASFPQESLEALRTQNGIRRFALQVVLQSIKAQQYGSCRFACGCKTAPAGLLCKWFYWTLQESLRAPRDPSEAQGLQGSRGGPLGCIVLPKDE